MQLNISELLKKKNGKQYFDLTFDLEYLIRDEYKVKLKAPIHIKGEAVNNGSIVEMKGVFTVLCEVQCSRCLDCFEDSFIVEFEESFSKAPVDEEIYPIIEDTINFDDMVMDDLILSMPVKFLCNKECKGLCHNCGKNLNKVSCDCEKDTINPKFAALKDLFKED
jgi:uncharacterized protein